MTNSDSTPKIPTPKFWQGVGASPPVLLVHGIWNTAAAFDRLSERLRVTACAGCAVSLEPNDGRAPIAQLASQLTSAVATLREQNARARIDLVGFSMGALVARYWLQRLGGAKLTRRFVSISGPHHGTWTAHCLPLVGAKQMRPGSELLRDLEADIDPFGEVDVYTLSTPYDLMIVPPASSRLAQARDHTTFPVLLHRWMLSDARVGKRVSEILSAE
ncbi:MAG TPA: alpha/beta fold hydrolase [Polyangiaceae bacterium]|nr:alpha/beta fold hydrolase [Polyangiaceae bacterium]